MLWNAEIVTKFELTVQQVVDALKDILSKILAFIAEEEGWVEE